MKTVLLKSVEVYSRLEENPLNRLPRGSSHRPVMHVVKSGWWAVRFVPSFIVAIITVVIIIAVSIIIVHVVIIRVSGLVFVIVFLFKVKTFQKTKIKCTKANARLVLLPKT